MEYNSSKCLRQPSHQALGELFTNFGCLGASSGPFRGVLRASWERFGVWGASWDVLGASWGRLGASWEAKPSWSPLGAVLEPSWKRLGDVLGRLGNVLGAFCGRLEDFFGRLMGLLARLGASWSHLVLDSILDTIL